MGFSPSFLGGARACSPGKFLKTEMLENTFPGILGLEIQTIRGMNLLSSNYTVKMCYPKKSIKRPFTQ